MLHVLACLMFIASCQNGADIQNSLKPSKNPPSRNRRQSKKRKAVSTKTGEVDLILIPSEPLSLSSAALEHTMSKLLDPDEESKSIENLDRFYKEFPKDSFLKLNGLMGVLLYSKVWEESIKAVFSNIDGYSDATGSFRRRIQTRVFPLVGHDIHAKIQNEVTNAIDTFCPEFKSAIDLSSIIDKFSIVSVLNTKPYQLSLARPSVMSDDPELNFKLHYFTILDQLSKLTCFKLQHTEILALKQIFEDCGITKEIELEILKNLDLSKISIAESGQNKDQISIWLKLIEDARQRGLSTHPDIH